MESIVRPKSLTELVTETLRDWIVRGELEPGGHLSEVRIANDLKVSRTPVREAFNRLEIEGLLIVKPQRGTFVFSLEPDELAKLCDARVCLETTAMVAAIETNPERLSAELAECVAKMTEARQRNDVSAYLSLDTDFHQILVDCSDNRFLNEAYQTIAPKMAALRNRLGRHPEHMAKSFREHKDLVKAVDDRDIGRALEILKSHIDRKEGSYWNDATTRPELNAVEG